MLIAEKGIEVLVDSLVHSGMYPEEERPFLVDAVNALNAIIMTQTTNKVEIIRIYQNKLLQFFRPEYRVNNNDAKFLMSLFQLSFVQESEEQGAYKIAGYFILFGLGAHPQDGPFLEVMPNPLLPMLNVGEWKLLKG